MQQKLLSLILLLYATVNVYSQAARMVINNNAYVRINNGAWVVLENGNANAITVTGTGANIVTEAENNRLRWMIGTNTGTYTIPFTTLTGVKFPLSLTLAAAGAGAGRIDFSTYPGPNWDNNTYRPSDVTHMFDYWTGTFNNSAYVIDRFWIIDANGYTTRPTPTISFTYIDAEHTPAGNTIIEANLRAQRFNYTTGQWGDLLPIGAINTVTNVVNAVSVTPADFYRSWTLVDLTSPLPIELTSFEADCKQNHKLISWQTASENNSNYFTIEKSYDGINFQFFKQIPAAGNSSIITNYQVIDYDNASPVYYKLTQTDFNGHINVFPLTVAECNSQNTFTAWSVPVNDGINVNVQVLSSQQIKFNLFDASGKHILSHTQMMQAGNNTLQLPIQNIATALYFLQITSETGEQITLKNYLNK
jgi:hypothetical protein